MDFTDGRMWQSTGRMTVRKATHVLEDADPFSVLTFPSRGGEPGDDSPAYKGDQFGAGVVFDCARGAMRACRRPRARAARGARGAAASRARRQGEGA
jgi:hypothetical protein